MYTLRETSEAAERILHEDREMPSGGTIGLVDYMGGDEAIAGAATLHQGPRVAGVSSVDDLLVGLAHNGIWRPFAFAEVKLRFETDLAGAHHLVYQPEASINQFSGRYSEFKEGASDLTLKGADEETEGLHRTISSELLGIYRGLLDESLAKETARGVTLDTTNTSFFYKANLAQLFRTVEDLDRRSWKHNEERASLAGELLSVARTIAPRAVEAYEAARAGESSDRIDWDLVARNAPKAVMAEAVFPSRSPTETQRVVVEDLERILFEPFEPIDNGLVRVTEYMGDFHEIANAARISYKSGTKVRGDEALVRTLLKNLHTTPFEMTELAFDVRMPLYIQRQSGRHRTLDEGRFMGELAIADERYVPADEHLAPQSTTNHQGRSGTLDEAKLERVKTLLEDSNRSLPDVSRMEFGIRDRLRPVDSWTRHSIKGDTHNLLHYVGLRADPHAQLEISKFGETFGGIMQRHLPVVMDAYDRFNRGAVSFDREELAVIDDVGGLRVGIDTVVEAAIEQGVFGSKNTARRRTKIDDFRKRLERFE